MLVLIAQAGLVANAGAEYLKNGVLGASVVAVAIVCVMLWRKNEALQNKIEELQQTRITEQAALQQKRLEEQQALQQLRINDAQAVSATLLKSTQENTAVLTNVTNAMNAQADAMIEVRASNERLGEHVREAIRKG